MELVKICVIIYKPENITIEKDTLKSCWNTNPDGAGFSVSLGKETLFKKGFMTFKSFWREYKKYNKEDYKVVIHFRITSKGISNKEQTHPYKKSKPDILSGTTKKPLYFMNGTINNLKLESGLNDTATFIRKYKDGIKATQQGAEIIAMATGCKWIIVTPENIFLGGEFINIDGCYYSNENHLFNFGYNNISEDFKFTVTIEDFITDSKLLKQLRNKEWLYYMVEDYIFSKCYYCFYENCLNCENCLMEAENITDIKRKLKIVE